MLFLIWFAFYQKMGKLHFIEKDNGNLVESLKNRGHLRADVTAHGHARGSRPVRVSYVRYFIIFSLALMR